MGLTDFRGGRILLGQFPDLKPLRPEMAKYQQMKAALREARQRVRDLEAQRPAAKKADQTAFAKVILAKGDRAPDQQGKEQSRLQGEIAKAQTRRDAHETALEIAEKALIDAVRAKRGELLRDVNGSLAKIGRDYAAAVEEVIGLRARRDELENLRIWVSGFPEHETELRTSSRPFTALKREGGQALTSAKVAAALREDANPSPKANQMPRPEPEAVTDAAA